jgi:hypothetical protein
LTPVRTNARRSTSHGMQHSIRETTLHLLHSLINAKRISINTADKLSMTVVLTAMNRFLNEDNGLQMAFLDGNQPERLCAPMKDYIEARGGEVRVKSPVKEIVTNEDGTVKHLLMRTGEIIGMCRTRHLKLPYFTSLIFTPYFP